MGEGSGLVPPRYDLDAKWNACFDLAFKLVSYSALAGAFGGLLLFRTPAARWSAVAFGAGVGLGSAYIDCSYIFEGSSPKKSPREQELRDRRGAYQQVFVLVSIPSCEVNPPSLDISAMNYLDS